jgi:hypothetical protein
VWEVRLLPDSCQLVEQRLGVLKVGGVEALGEPGYLGASRSGPERTGPSVDVIQPAPASIAQVSRVERLRVARGVVRLAERNIAVGHLLDAADCSASTSFHACSNAASSSSVRRTLLTPYFSSISFIAGGFIASVSAKLMGVFQPQAASSIAW